MRAIPTQPLNTNKAGIYSRAKFTVYMQRYI